MTKFAQYGASVVIIHASMVALHGLSHGVLPVSLSLFQGLFVGIVIVLAPLFAAILLWTRFSRMGAAILLGSMMGALAFGLYNHFIFIGPDHVSQVPSTGWGILFQTTAVLLAVTEGLGVGVGIWGLRNTSQQAIIQ
ncbi:MAG: hypothetical protein F6J95_014595 [Leptolyngbya sp. SIO1E4]|nr:hypothetical protein [Leptolyngbya sp. SIO1E4]